MTALDICTDNCYSLPMAPRTKKLPPLLVPETIRPAVREAAQILGSTSQDVVLAGCRLFCAFVRTHLQQPGLPQGRPPKGNIQWQLNQLVKALASRFAHPAPNSPPGAAPPSAQNSSYPRGPATPFPRKR